jgi:Undecaprenyl-phosphate galactose phosphotransferase WbaP
MHTLSLQELGTELRRSVVDPVRRSVNRSSRLRTSLVLVTSDATVLALVLLCAIWMRSLFAAGTVPFTEYVVIAGVLVVGNALASAWRGMYPGYGMCAIAELRSTFYSVTGIFALVIAMSFFSRDWPPYSRSILLASYVLSVPALAASRMVVRKFLSRFSWYGIPVIIIGVNSMATRIVDTLRNHMQIGLRPLAIVEPDGEDAEFGYHKGVPVIGGLEFVEPLSSRYNVTHGVVAMPHTSADRISSILEDHCHHLAHVTIVGEHVHPSVIWISNSSSDVLLSSEIEQRLRHPSLRLKKRLFDLALGIPLFLLALPVMVVVSLAVMLTSGRPLLYRQQRVGERGRVFKVMKFRTMEKNADERLQSILDRSPEAREEWDRYHKLKNDPRVTALGKFLRKYSLDELPQMWNVLRGEMSLIGFRPFTPGELDSLPNLHRRVPIGLYDSTKPGLSGLWQVTVRADAAFEDRTHIDLYYMRNWSLFLDLYLLIRTAGVVLTGKGAY